MFSDQTKRDELTLESIAQDLKNKEKKKSLIEQNENSWITMITENLSGDPRFVSSMWTIDPTIYSEYGEHGISLMKTYMKNLKNLLDKQNIKLTICVYPWPTQVWYDDVESLQVKIWSEFAKNNQIDFINFFPYFIKAGLSDIEKVAVLKKYFIYSYQVLNKKGHKLIADKFLEKYQRLE